jgi:formate dehydrogenase subunit delta
VTPIDKLVMMANQIARNFAVEGEAAAVTATADHIAKFWDPRMRTQVRDAQGLSPIAAAAVARLP